MRWAVGRRIAAVTCGCLLALPPTAARAQALSAQFQDTWATRGQDVRVSVDVDDPIGVAHRVVFELLVDGVQTTTATTTRPFVATFAAEDVWPRDPQTLEVRAEVLGRRGGLLLQLGYPFALTLEILEPAESLKRTSDLERAAGSDTSVVAVGLGLEGRVGSPARIRVRTSFVGWTPSFVRPAVAFSVGPAFAEPPGFEDGGPIALGTDAGVRWLAPRVWFVDTLLTADFRFPGVDLGGSVYLGAKGPWGDIEWMVAAGGGALAAGIEDRAEAAFFGSARIGVLFGGSGR